MTSVYYLLVAFSAFLFSVGLVFLKKSFFNFALATTSLLNIMLDTQLDEDEKQKLLIKKIGRLLSSFGIFLLFFAFITSLALLPIVLYTNLRQLPLKEIDTSSFYFYLSMLIGGIIIFIIPFKKKQQDYSDWSKLLHKLVLDNHNLSKALFKLEKRIFKKKITSPDKNFVIVTGLARAGTTALTNLLHAKGNFHSISYENMPFLLSPNIWRTFYKPKKDKLKERAHGDQIKIGYNSIEALEEYFFKTFTGNSFIQEDSIELHTISSDTFEAYKSYQKLFIKEGADSTYLAKNNNLMLRYPSMRAFDADFKIVLLFRNPLDHAHSLIKQHENFCDQQKEDEFVLAYMNWLGHHEFGLNQKRFHFNEGVAHFSDKENIDYWLEIWKDYYTYILSLEDDPNLILVDYEDLLLQPNTLLNTLSKELNITLKVESVEQFKKQPSKTPVPSEDLYEQAKEVYEQLQQKKLKSVH